MDKLDNKANYSLLVAESHIAAVLEFNCGYVTYHSIEDLHEVLGDHWRISPYRTTPVRNLLAPFAC